MKFCLQKVYCLFFEAKKFAIYKLIVNIAANIMFIKIVGLLWPKVWVGTNMNLAKGVYALYWKRWQSGWLGKLKLYLGLLTKSWSFSSIT